MRMAAPTYHPPALPHALLLLLFLPHVLLLLQAHHLPFSSCCGCVHHRLAVQPTQQHDQTIKRHDASCPAVHVAGPTFSSRSRYAMSRYLPPLPSFIFFPRTYTCFLCLQSSAKTEATPSSNTTCVSAQAVSSEPASRVGDGALFCCGIDSWTRLGSANTEGILAMCTTP